MNYSAAIAFLDKASSRTVTLHISQQRMNEDRQPKGCLFVLFGYELFQEGEVVDVQLAVLVDVGGGPLSKVGIWLIEQPLLEQHGVCDISGSVAVYVAKFPHLIRLDSLAVFAGDGIFGCWSVRGYVDRCIAGLCGVDRTVVDGVVSRILYRYNEPFQNKESPVIFCACSVVLIRLRSHRHL